MPLLLWKQHTQMAMPKNASATAPTMRLPGVGDAAIQIANHLISNYEMQSFVTREPTQTWPCANGCL